jgi:hypothetical protein
VSEFFHDLESRFEPGKTDVTLEKVLVDGFVRMHLCEDTATVRREQ